MTDNVIKLGKSDVLRLSIRTNEGKEIGEYLEFDLNDIELPLKYQELIEKNDNLSYTNLVEKAIDVLGTDIVEIE